jgi:hypothetical protein
VRTALISILLITIGAGEAASQQLIDLKNKVWMRTDGQRIMGNKKLEEQDRADRASCLSANPESADGFMSCMATKGYAIVDRQEGEQRLAAAAAARAKRKEGASSGKDQPEDGRRSAERGDLNIANRRILALTEKDRRNVFAAQLGLSGENCGEVTRTFYRGSAKPSWNAIWNVQCSSGTAYSILVMSDEKGSTKVMTCGELRAVGGGECFVRN